MYITSWLRPLVPGDLIMIIIAKISEVFVILFVSIDTKWKFKQKIKSKGSRDGKFNRFLALKHGVFIFESH